MGVIIIALLLIWLIAFAGTGCDGHGSSNGRRGVGRSAAAARFA